MARTQTVTIPLDEYKELLLRDKPDEHEKEVLGKLLDVLFEGLSYDEEDRYYSSYSVGNHLKCDDGTKVVKEMLTMLKYVDREMYMGIWNAVNTGRRERMAREAMIEQMNMAREIRAE